MFERLEERDFPRINNHVINIVDADRASNVQTSRLGEKDVIIAAVAVVVIRGLTGVSPRINEDESIPLIVPLTRLLSRVEVRKHGEHDVSPSTFPWSPCPQARTEYRRYMLPVRDMAHRGQFISVRGRQWTHDIGERQPPYRVTGRDTHTVQSRRARRVRF